MTELPPPSSGAHPCTPHPGLSSSRTLQLHGLLLRVQGWARGTAQAEPAERLLQAGLSTLSASTRHLEHLSPTLRLAPTPQESGSGDLERWPRFSMFKSAPKGEVIQTQTGERLTAAACTCLHVAGKVSAPCAAHVTCTCGLHAAASPAPAS